MESDAAIEALRRRPEPFNWRYGVGHALYPSPKHVVKSTKPVDPDSELE